MTNVAIRSDVRLVSREANHRFLNTLTTLHGLLRIDFNQFADAGVREAVGVFSSRIQAFASLHRTLAEDADEGLVDVRAHFERLCAELCAAHLAPRGIHCELKADHGFLPRETCQQLSLIVVELVTNAAKHAFTGRAGQISIALLHSSEGWICRVADNGAGLRGDQHGNGMRLIWGLAKALGSDMRVQSSADGVVVTMALPQDSALVEASTRSEAAAN